MATEPVPDHSMEKVFSDNGRPIEPRDESREDAISHIKTAGSITISPELFEKLYLMPVNNVKGDLRAKFANPTPLGLVGFVIALTPLCCDLMGWRGAGGGGAAEIGPFYWFGGALQLIAGVLEFFLGNTFPFVVLSSFGAFFLSFATTLTPFYNASEAYGDDISGYHASFGYFPLFMGLLCLFYLICAIRTNLLFVSIFFTVIIALGLLTAAHWQIAQSNHEAAARIEIAAGATAFVSSIAAWYLLLSQLLEAVDFPFQLPVGDLSRYIKAQNHRAEKDASHKV